MTHVIIKQCLSLSLDYPSFARYMNMTFTRYCNCSLKLSLIFRMAWHQQTLCIISVLAHGWKVP